jgi:AraC family transcriptional regulator
MRQVTLEDYKARMLRVLVHIQQHLDRELSLEELAGVAHFSPYHFHRIFRGMVGESLASHIRRIRLERAAGRLRFTDHPITDIAFEAGYETHEAFTRAFRSMSGLSPSEYRNQRRAIQTPHASMRVHYTADVPPGDFEPLDSGGSTMKAEIKHMAPKRVAFMRHVGPYDQVGPTWDAFVTRMGAQGHLQPGIEMIGFCHDDPDVTPADKVRYDACITVGPGFEPEGEIGVQEIPGGDYAVTTHRGPYERLGETYAHLCGQWIPRQGRIVRSKPCYQLYLNDPDDTPPEELLTDIYMPLEPLGDDES